MKLLSIGICMLFIGTAMGVHDTTMLQTTENTVSMSQDEACFEVTIGTIEFSTVINQIEGETTGLNQPSVLIDSPADGTTVYLRNISVHGFAYASSSECRLVYWESHWVWEDGERSNNSDISPPADICEFWINISSLALGWNTISATFQDACGSYSSDAITVYYEDIDPPEVVITYPSNGSEFTEKNITIQGYVDDHGGSGVVYLKWMHEWDGGYNVDGHYFDIPCNRFTFEIPLELHSGENTITINSTDLAGNNGLENVIVFNHTWYFIHIADTHIDAGDESASRFEKVIQNINSLKPDFVLITGDLVDWAVGIDQYHGIIWYQNFNTFINLVGTINTNIKCLYIPGNHDRYAEFPTWPFYTTVNLNNYKQKLGEPEWTYDWKNVFVVGKDSGSDVASTKLWSALELADIPIPPWGEGITTEQLKSIETEFGNQADKIKVLCMHHPVISYTEEIYLKIFGYRVLLKTLENISTITNNRNELMQYCEGKKILVLGGHLHKALIADGTGKLYQNANIKLTRTLYVLTSSVKDQLAYRRIRISGNTATVMKEEYAASTASFIVTGNADIGVYDSMGQYMGKDSGNNVVCDIPGAVYSPEKLYKNEPETASVLYGVDNYTFVIKGINKGTFNLIVRINLENGEKTEFDYESIPIDSDSTCYYYVNADSVDKTIYIDYDSDGIIDKEMNLQKIP